MNCVSGSDPVSLTMMRATALTPNSAAIAPATGAIVPSLARHASFICEDLLGAMEPAETCGSHRASPRILCHGFAVICGFAGGSGRRRHAGRGDHEESRDREGHRPEEQDAEAHPAV